VVILVFVVGFFVGLDFFFFCLFFFWPFLELLLVY